MDAVATEDIALVFIDCLLPTVVIPKVGIAHFGDSFWLHDRFEVGIGFAFTFCKGLHDEASWSFFVARGAEIHPRCDDSGEVRVIF